VIIEVFSRFNLRRLRKQWYFRIRAGNQEILAQSEGYQNQADALGTVKLLQKGLGGAELKVLE
jgi:uncharacterized protein YegP (UPF0339 family)